MSSNMKTTTTINLINLYQETYNQKKEISYSFNASDDRGIDIKKSNKSICKLKVYLQME